MRLLNLYDNYKANDDFEIGWGFSCLIESDGKKILFDVGEEDKKIFSNMERAGVKASDIDILVISHTDWDHIGGLSSLRKLNPSIEVYMPDAFSEPRKIAEGIYTTGLMKAEPDEQSLVLKSEKGLVIITGCAHPGIVQIIKKVKLFFKEQIYLVLGGFHLMDNPEEEVSGIINEFKELGVNKVAPSHCTGKKAIDMFKRKYKDNFIENFAGNIIKI